MSKLEVVVAGASDVGAIREHNEDSFLVGDLDTGKPIDLAEVWTNADAERGPLLIVCDGMGGVAGGEVASELASKAMWREMRESVATRDAEVFARLLRRAARLANQDIQATSEREPGLKGMGTTLSAAGLVGDRLVIATVGDSRAYILREGALVQVTRDQSLSSALLAAGSDPMEAASAGGAILQALGVGDDVDPSLSIIDVRRGDRVLLCSDGLHGLVGDPALAILLSPPHPVQESVRMLVAAARAAGGTDNITAVVAELSGDRLEPPENEDDLPTFREFDPQREGDPALTSTSYVARRLAQRIGIPVHASIPPTLPVTGQHKVVRATPRRLAPTALPVPQEDIEDIDGPARRRLAGQGPAWWIYVAAAVVAGALAWVLGGR